MFWLAEDRCVVAQSAASRNAEGRLDLHLRLRGLQFGAHAEPDAQRSSDVVSRGRSVSEWSCNASLGRSVARKITPQMLENPRITQTDQEIAGSARFFRSLLGFPLVEGNRLPSLSLQIDHSRPSPAQAACPSCPRAALRDTASASKTPGSR